MGIFFSSGNYFEIKPVQEKSFLSNSVPLFNFKHKDLVSIEFNRDPLIPYASTNLGPQISVADIDNNGTVSELHSQIAKIIL